MTVVETAAGVRERRVIEGEAMVTPARRFRCDGEVYEPGRTRLVADHPLVLRHPGLFEPSMDGDESVEIARFEERRREAVGETRVTGERDTGREAWRLDHEPTAGRETWRL